MEEVRLLQLSALAKEALEDYDLIQFEGHEALSEPFRYDLQILARETPRDLNDWIGQLVEFSVNRQNRLSRTFAGRIYEATVRVSADGLPTIALVVRPAYWAAQYARGTSFIQDKSSLEIFSGITADVPGLIVDTLASGAAKRPYAVRYDESELAFLDRLLAQDGFFYAFGYDRAAGGFRHRMRIGSSTSAYVDLEPDLALTFAEGAVSGLERRFHAAAGKRFFHALENDRFDQPLRDIVAVSTDSASIYGHAHETITAGVGSADQARMRANAYTSALEQGLQTQAGASAEPGLTAGGRISLTWAKASTSRKVVLTSVHHSAYDPSRQGNREAAVYSNRFTAIDARLTFCPPAPAERQRAYGPMLGVVGNDEAAEGRIVVDDRSRVPVVMIPTSHAEDTSASTPFVWLPVQQQWAGGTHGAQFLPRTGTRVVVDFLYGDPDLPFITGTIYTPSARYPFNPSNKATKTGWQSKTDGNGAVTQHFLFEDKPGAEEIHLYSGRDYRHQVDHDETTTIGHDRAITVDNDHREQVKHDQAVTVGHNQTITVENDRNLQVTGKNKLQSAKEIEFAVGASSIRITPQSIEIKAPTITIKADVVVDVSAGAQARVKAPVTQVNADGMLVLKGGIVMIN